MARHREIGTVEKPQTFWGSEVVSAQTRMRLKMLSYALLLALIAHACFVFWFMLHRWGTTAMFYVPIRYWDARIKSQINPDTTTVSLCVRFLKDKNGRAIRCAAWGQYPSGAALQYLTPFWQAFKGDLLKAFIVGIWLYPLVTFLLLRFFKRQAHQIAETTHVRGRRLLTVQELAKKAPTPGRLPLLKGFKLPVEWEPRHLLILGKTGTGKTTLISQQLERLRKDGQRVIAYDYKGDYLRKFYDPDRGDLILNPCDARCLNWQILKEVSNHADIHALAASLFPHLSQRGAGGESDFFFQNSARDVFSGVLECLKREGKQNNADIWEKLNLPNPALVAWLKDHNHPSVKYVEDASSKQALGVFATVAEYTQFFRFMAEVEGPCFSVRDWVVNGNGWIFIENRAEVKAILRPVLSLFVDMLARAVLSLPDDRNRRIFFVVDELGTLQKLPSLLDFLTLARSKGGCLIAGTQDLGRLKERYGQTLETIINNFSSLLSFAVEGETAEKLANWLGKREIAETDINYGFGPDDIRDGLGLQKKKKEKMLVLPSEIATLPPFHCYFRAATGEVVKGEIEKRFIPDQWPEDRIFVPAPSLEIGTAPEPAKPAEEETVMAETEAETPEPDEPEQNNSNGDEIENF